VQTSHPRVELLEMTALSPEKVKLFLDLEREEDPD
jgi:hypothetical protein